MLTTQISLDQETCRAASRPPSPWQAMPRFQPGQRSYVAFSILWPPPMPEQRKRWRPSPGTRSESFICSVEVRETSSFASSQRMPLTSRYWPGQPKRPPSETCWFRQGRAALCRRILMHCARSWLTTRTLCDTVPRRPDQGAIPREQQGCPCSANQHQGRCYSGRGFSRNGVERAQPTLCRAPSNTSAGRVRHCRTRVRAQCLGSPARRRPEPHDCLRRARCIESLFHRCRTRESKR